MYQTQRGFQAVLGQLSAIQTSLGVLQSTTAVIGVGVFTGVALSAVNLWQTLKLRQDVKQLRLEVKDGFIDLKEAFKNQGLEIISHMDQVAQDITFAQHRLELIKAYGYFLEATKLMKTAVSLQNPQTKTIELANIRQTLGESLAIYNNPHLLSEISAPGQLRRLECAWIIEQTIALTYQLQNELTAASDRLSYLKETIGTQAVEVINHCKTEEELEFLFAEISRISNHDLVVLDSWQNHLDWWRSLSDDEQVLLANSELIVDNYEAINDNNQRNKPEELSLYENLKQKSHLGSLRDQLRFMMKPDLRQKPEIYISEKSQQLGYQTMIPSNLKTASDLTIANLYWYFRFQDKVDNPI